MRRQQRMWRACAAVGSLTACVACGPKNTLEPAKSANVVEGRESAVRAQQGNITLMAVTDAWVGREEVLKEVTPLRVTIENRSDHAVQLKYSNFSLNAQNGQRFAALPPVQIDGEITARVGTAVDPTWTATEYEVAPYYGTFYGGYASVWDGPFTYDYSYYDAYYPMWTALELPTQEMLQHALPEGTLKPGGRVEGFLYFQKVGGDADRVVMKAKLIDPQGQRPVTTLSVPFEVDD